MVVLQGFHEGIRPRRRAQVQRQQPTSAVAAVVAQTLEELVLRVALQARIQNLLTRLQRRARVMHTFVSSAWVPDSLSLTVQRTACRRSARYKARAECSRIRIARCGILRLSSWACVRHFTGYRNTSRAWHGIRAKCIPVWDPL